MILFLPFQTYPCRHLLCSLMHLFILGKKKKKRSPTMTSYTGTFNVYRSRCVRILALYQEKKKKKKKRSPTMTQLYRDFPQRLCTWSFRECRRHYSSWEVSRESQSSPLRFFVESIATDHQEVSSFFSEKKTVLLRIRTRDLEPRVVSPDQPDTQPATVTYLFYY